MVRMLFAMVAAAGLFSPTWAVAQHVGDGAGDPALGPCAGCHSPHQGNPGSSNLKTDKVLVWSQRAGGSGEALGLVSQSCLRCHASPGTRQRQPEYVARLSEGREGTFLGYDLTTQHPLGRLGRTALGLRSFRDDPLRSLRRPTQSFEMKELTCTGCHDPHDRSGLLPTPERLSSICASCHDTGQFGFDSHASLSCSDCHSLHDGTPGRLLTRNAEDVTCRGCHDPNAPATEFRPERGGGPAFPPDHPAKLSATESCFSCHAIHR